MTLKTRNRSIFFFICFSLICCCLSFVLLISRISNGSFEQIFGFKFLSPHSITLFSPSDTSVIFALLALQVYIPITAFFLFFNFEKTQSTLIILFTVFLLGCQFQLSKLVIGLMNYKINFSFEYLILGKIFIMGKLMAIASFFLISSEAKDSKKLNIDNDILILLVICLVITLSIPLKTGEPTNNFEITPGYLSILNVLSLTTILLTIITFIFSYQETEDFSMIKLLIDSCLIIAGFFILTSTVFLWQVIIGIILLVVGTYMLFRTLHKMYLWS